MQHSESERSYVARHKWPLFHFAGCVFAVGMRLVAQRHRFRLALLFARAIVPVVRRTEAYRLQRACKIDGDIEIALHLVLSVLTKTGVAFDPLFVVSGYDELRKAHAGGQGVLLICPHATLSLLLPRLLHNQGLQAIVIAADPLTRIGGTSKLAHVLQPSPTFLVTMTALLRGGRIVCAMPDRAEHHPRQTVQFETAAGPIIIAPALMRVAARCGARVVFSEMHVEGHAIGAAFIAASAADDPSADVITADFIEFVRAHINSRFREKLKCRDVVRFTNVETDTKQAS